MRAAARFAPLVLVVLALIPASAAEPTQRELLDAIERQLAAAHETAGPAMACVVISRSEFYAKPAKLPERPGTLGTFDLKEFVKANPGKDELAATLNLSDRRSIPDNSYAGGIVVDPVGLILVMAHSIEGATKIYVHLPGGKGSYADIHALDARSDLAVLRLISPPEGLKAINFSPVRVGKPAAGERSLFPGKLVIHMVNPAVTGFVPGRASASLGSLTNIRRRPVTAATVDVVGPQKTIYHYGLFLEHDARVNSGCSGGALLDLDGDLIGITSGLVASAGGETGPGYALPMDTNTRRIIDVLRRGEEVEYGYLGVTLRQGVNTRIVIDAVAAQSPASAARLDSGDEIFRIDGNNAENYDDLLLYLGSALAGTKVQLGVKSPGGRIKETEVTLAKFKHDLPYIASVRPDPVFGLRVDYSSVLAQILRQNPRTDGNGVPPGVCVRELVPDSPAAAKFKALGDNTRWLITAVNGTPTPTPAEFYKAAKGQQSLKLTVTDPGEITPRLREITLP